MERRLSLEDDQEESPLEEEFPKGQLGKAQKKVWDIFNNPSSSKVPPNIAITPASVPAPTPTLNTTPISSSPPSPRRPKW